ncbi:hypothetical protein D3C87_2039910 [compost metagenome]
MAILSDSARSIFVELEDEAATAAREGALVVEVIGGFTTATGFFNNDSQRAAISARCVSILSRLKRHSCMQTFSETRSLISALSSLMTFEN